MDYEKAWVQKFYLYWCVAEYYWYKRWGVYGVRLHCKKKKRKKSQLGNISINRWLMNELSFFSFKSTLTFKCWKATGFLAVIPLPLLKAIHDIATNYQCFLFHLMHSVSLIRRLFYTLHIDPSKPGQCVYVSLCVKETAMLWIILRWKHKTGCARWRGGVADTPRGYVSVCLFHFNALYYFCRSQGEIWSCIINAVWSKIWH